MKKLTIIALAVLLTIAGAPLAAAPHADIANGATGAHRLDLDQITTTSLENATGGRWSKFGCTTLLFGGAVYLVLGEATNQSAFTARGLELLGMSQIMCV